MSQFNATKCDECGRIQGESNHWMRIRVLREEKKCVGVVIFPTGTLTPIEGEIHDLCGQGCAMKHIGTLLGWNVKGEPADAG